MVGSGRWAAKATRLSCPPLTAHYSLSELPMNNIPWWVYVILAGLAWGTYVPIIFYGGTELTTKPGTIGGRLASILCVGAAYFILGVVIPVILMSLRDDAQPEWRTN